MFSGAVHIDFPAVASLFCWAEEAMVIGVTIQLALYPDQDVALQRSGTSVNVCIYMKPKIIYVLVDKSL